MLWNKPRTLVTGMYDRQRNSLLGPRYTSEQVCDTLESICTPYEHIRSEDIRASILAKALAKGSIVGLAEGRMEFGPRSLGARSILADPRSPYVKERLNKEVKNRESFRPFAAALLKEDARQYFSFTNESPYMLLSARISDQYQSILPAVTHADLTCRLQIVSNESSFLYKLLHHFKRLTGLGVLLNTSLNIAGVPIARTPSDAYSCFVDGGLDILMIEDCIVYRNEKQQFLYSEDQPLFNKPQIKSSPFPPELESILNNAKLKLCTPNKLPVTNDYPFKSSSFWTSPLTYTSCLVEAPRNKQEQISCLVEMWESLGRQDFCEFAIEFAELATQLKNVDFMSHAPPSSHYKLY